MNDFYIQSNCIFDYWSFTIISMTVDYKKIFLFIVVFLLVELNPMLVQAQIDSTQKASIENFVLKRKGVFGKLAKNILVDTNAVIASIPTYVYYAPFNNKTIRKIQFTHIEFGKSIKDTTPEFKNFFIHLANSMHINSKEWVIRNQLFFNEGDLLNPYLLADNEKHLRDLPYIQDVRFNIKVDKNDPNVVDIEVLTKDVFAFGASFNMHGLDRYTLAVDNQNIGGWGDELLLQGNFDYERVHPMRWAGRFVKRNIGGTFIDAYANYNEFVRSIEGGRREEIHTSLSLERPLVNANLKWVYAAEWMRQKNLNDEYRLDTFFNKRLKYDRENIDFFFARNFKIDKDEKLMEDRYRLLAGLRVYSRYFLSVPDTFSTIYNYQFHNERAVLLGGSLYKQEFVKSNYIYGFGRSEDVPTGVDFQLNLGRVNKYSTNRWYGGLGFRLREYLPTESYIDYTIKLGGFLNKRKFEDLALLFNLDAFSKLRPMGDRWKYRVFSSLGFTAQKNVVLNEPLWLESEFGLPELYNQRTIFGNARTTAKIESVFYSPINFVNFKLAPFSFVRMSLLNPYNRSFWHNDLYTSVGGGVRLRNESLIFGTLEFKFFYFPEPNFRNEHWRFEFKSNIRFKYNQRIIKRPEIFRLNQAN